MHHLKRLNLAMSPAAMLVAILALVVAAGGAGYAAGQIGTSGIKNKAITTKKIKNNAVTAPKIKANAVNGSKIADRSVGNADLAPESGFRRIHGHDSPQGDCRWAEVSEAIPAVLPSGYRKTRSGVVEISAFLAFSNQPGGDADCGGADDIEDFTAFTLPTGYRPAKPMVRFIAGSYRLYIGGVSDSIVGAKAIPAGAVVWVDLAGATSSTVPLDFSFTAAGAPGAATSARTTHASHPENAHLFR